MEENPLGLLESEETAPQNLTQHPIQNASGESGNPPEEADDDADDDDDDDEFDDDEEDDGDDDADADEGTKEDE